MNIHLKQKFGITLVEVAIGAVLVSLMIAGLMNFFSFGLRGSKKGMENLTNMGEASILMSQIELDLMRGRQLISPSPGDSSTAAEWRLERIDDSETSTVSYRQLSKGVERTEKGGAEQEKYVFCRDRNVNISFDHLSLKDLPEEIDRTAVLVALSVSGSPDGKAPSEEFRMIRLITCHHETE
ncbi:MAG: type IV pilus modification PilV family protein [Candidatus Rifleibacteriota bacterium]